MTNTSTTSKIVIHIPSQTLTLDTDSATTYPISSGKNGVGQLEGSGCTPLGTHVICAKIGDGLPVNSVFVGRVATGEIYSEQLAKDNPSRDWILTRILWLDGCEMGVNKGHTADGQCCDTKARYIYIHGTPDSEPMGEPHSHGCIRMRHDDLLKVFDKVDVGTVVEIVGE